MADTTPLAAILDAQLVPLPARPAPALQFAVGCPACLALVRAVQAAAALVPARSTPRRR